MKAKPPSAADDFYRATSPDTSAAGRERSANRLVERIRLEEVLDIFRPDDPPMDAVRLVWDNPDGLDVVAMRERLRGMAGALKAKPLNDAVDAMVTVVDEAIRQLDTSPTGLTLAQATALKEAAVRLRELLTASRLGA